MPLSPPPPNAHACESHMGVLAVLRPVSLPFQSRDTLFGSIGLVGPHYVTGPSKGYAIHGSRVHMRTLVTFDETKAKLPRRLVIKSMFPRLSLVWALKNCTVYQYNQGLETVSTRPTCGCPY